MLILLETRGREVYIFKVLRYYWYLFLCGKSAGLSKLPDSQDGDSEEVNISWPHDWIGVAREATSFLTNFTGAGRHKNMVSFTVHIDQNMYCPSLYQDYFIKPNRWHPLPCGKGEETVAATLPRTPQWVPNAPTQNNNTMWIRPLRRTLHAFNVLPNPLWELHVAGTCLVRKKLLFLSFVEHTL